MQFYFLQRKREYNRSHKEKRKIVILVLVIVLLLMPSSKPLTRCNKNCCTCTFVATVKIGLKWWVEFEFVHHEPQASGLRILRVFYQHLKWFISLYYIDTSVLRNISKMSASVSSGFQTREKLMKARGRRPSAFIVFECLKPR